MLYSMIILIIQPAINNNIFHYHHAVETETTYINVSFIADSNIYK